jgi:prepilin-type processing-associated H-X9-DG protein
MSNFLAILLYVTVLFTICLSSCACNMGDDVVNVLFMDGSIFFIVVCYNPNRSNS